MRLTGTICAALVLALLVCAPADAQAQRLQRLATDSGLLAVGTAQEFEILTAAGAMKSTYYCAAGEFAWIRLGARNTDDLIVVSRDVPSRYSDRRYAVVFRLANAGRQGLFALNLGGPFSGQSMSVGHARSLCNVAKHHGHRRKHH